jgi:hypothetical protein
MINQNIVSNIKIPQQLIVSKSIELGTPAKDAILGSLEFKETKNKTNIIKKTIKKLKNLLTLCSHKQKKS